MVGQKHIEDAYTQKISPSDRELCSQNQDKTSRKGELVYYDTKSQYDFRLNCSLDPDLTFIIMEHSSYQELNLDITLVQYVHNR